MVLSDILDVFDDVDHFAVNHAMRICERLLVRGINRSNVLELHEAAIEGPWPAHITPRRLGLGMKVAYMMLEELTETSIDDEEVLKKNIISDLWDLKYAWQTIHDDWVRMF